MRIRRMFICVCNAVNERRVRETVQGGAMTLRDLQNELGVATCCGRCAKTAREYLPGGAQGPALARAQRSPGLEVTQLSRQRVLQVA